MASKGSRLGNVVKGQLEEPLRCLFYSDEGVGKTTLAAHAPAPIFADVEGGSGHVEVARYPYRDGDDGHIPRTYEEFLGGLADLFESPHEYRTLVIDTIDALEPLIWSYVCRRESGKKSNVNKNGKEITSIEKFPYGRGYGLALDEWRVLCGKLDRIRARRKMGIVLLGHSVVRLFKNPIAEDFDRIQLRVHEKCGGFLKEYCDVVGYLAFEQHVGKMLEEEDRMNSRVKGFSSGERLLHLQRTAAYDAKTRVPLPSEIALSVDDPWAPFAAALVEGRGIPAPQIVSLIEKELVRLADDDLTKRVRAKVKKAKESTATLSRYLMTLKNRSTESKEETQNA